jgi:hypothetical protein
VSADEAALGRKIGHGFKSYWAGRAGVPLRETSKSRLPAFLREGLPSHGHRADEDAARQAEIFKRMRAWTPTDDTR